MSSPSTIRVEIARHKGWYIATSPSLAGLFVSHKSLTKLLDEIPAGIKLLLEASYKRNFDVIEAPEPEAEGLGQMTYVAEERQAA